MDCNHQCYGLALERVRRAFTVDKCGRPHATLGIMYVLQECLHCIHPDCVQDDKQTKVCHGLGGSPSMVRQRRADSPHSFPPQLAG